MKYYKQLKNGQKIFSAALYLLCTSMKESVYEVNKYAFKRV